MTLSVDLLDWRTVAFALTLFGIAPGVLLRMLVSLYPKDHPRREELLGELDSVPYLERPFFVASQVETSVREGLVARWRERRYLGPRHGKDMSPGEWVDYVYSARDGVGLNDDLDRHWSLHRWDGDRILIVSLENANCDSWLIPAGRLGSFITLLDGNPTDEALLRFLGQPQPSTEFPLVDEDGTEWFIGSSRFFEPEEDST
jgi:hypothetical protein